MPTIRLPFSVPELRGGLHEQMSGRRPRVLVTNAPFAEITRSALSCLHGNSRFHPFPGSFSGRFHHRPDFLASFLLHRFEGGKPSIKHRLVSPLCLSSLYDAVYPCFEQLIQR